MTVAESRSQKFSPHTHTHTKKLCEVKDVLASLTLVIIMQHMYMHTLYMHHIIQLQVTCQLQLNKARGETPKNKIKKRIPLLSVTLRHLFPTQCALDQG